MLGREEDAANGLRGAPQVAYDLYELWKVHGPASWQNFSIDNKSLTMSEALDWPGGMPERGFMRVNTQRNSFPRLVVSRNPNTVGEAKSKSSLTVQPPGE